MNGEEQRPTQSFPVFRALGIPAKGQLDKFLSLFADVRAGEGAGALLLALNAFLLLFAYYLLKTVREALILGEGGAEVKTYSSAGQALLLLLVVPLYGSLASRFRRTGFITWVTLFFVVNLVAFFVLGMQGAREGVVFFLWLGIFNVLVIAQYWAFANDIYSESQGKRLFPILGTGASLGAVTGADTAARLIHATGPYALMLIAAVLLAATVPLVHAVHRRDLARRPVKQTSTADAPLGSEGGFQLVFRDRYLLLIALLIVLLNVVNTGGEYILGKLLTQEAAAKFGMSPESEAARKAFIGAFYGRFFSLVNLAGLLLQMFAVSRVFHYVGVGGALYVLPLIALSGYSLMTMMPALALVRIVKILENSVDYSVQNTARQALFLPTSREAKYKAKAAIDTFFVRTGDVLAAGVVYAGTAFSISITAFAAVNLALTACWLWVVTKISREYKRRSRQTTKP